MGIHLLGGACNHISSVFYILRKFVYMLPKPNGHCISGGEKFDLEFIRWKVVVYSIDCSGSDKFQYFLEYTTGYLSIQVKHLN